MLGDTISIRAWEDGPGRVIFDAMVNDKQVVSNAYFEYVWERLFYTFFTEIQPYPATF